MTNKIYNFSVPVCGEEHFSVVASSYEEAVEKIHREDYYSEPKIDDIDWDFGFRSVDEELPKCYTISDYEEDFEFEEDE